MTRSALVTGAAGFIGQHVVQQLLTDGWHVAGYDVLPKPVELDCAWHTASILDAPTLRQAMSGCDTVFHLAARAHLFAPDPLAFDEINHQGTQLVAACAARSSVTHFIATLSAVALTPMHFKGVIDGTRRPKRAELAGPYAQSKWDADVALDQCSAQDIAITKLYPTIPVGAGDTALTAPTAMLKLFLTQPPPAFLETVLNFVPVEDIASAHVKAAALTGRFDEEGQRRYLLSGERWPLRRLLGTLHTLTGRPMPKRAIPYAIARLAASFSERTARIRQASSLATVEGVRLTTADPTFDARETHTDLDWEPSSVCGAIKQAVDWLKKFEHI